jgi:hypothetical protein
MTCFFIHNGHCLMNFDFYRSHFLGESPSIFAHGVIHFVTAVALPRFFVLAHVLVAGGASALVLDLVLVAGVVDFGAVCAATTLRCLRFYQLKVLVLVLRIGGVLVGFSVGLKTAHPICCLANSSDCAIKRVSCWAVSVSCTLGTEWVIVGIVVYTLRTGGVVQTGVTNNLAMAGCWWMACSVSSTSCRISSAPLGLVMSFIAFVQSAIAFMTLSAWVMVGLVMFS